MKRYLTRFLVALVLVGGIAACRTASVYNVHDASFTSEAPTLDAAEKAIRLAGASLGWQMKTESPGHLVATLPIRSHLAVTDITFDQDSYSIIYKDSNNLKYNGSTIHSNYNGWIQNLQAAIGAQTSSY